MKEIKKWYSTKAYVYVTYCLLGPLIAAMIWSIYYYFSSGWMIAGSLMCLILVVYILGYAKLSIDYKKSYFNNVENGFIDDYL